MGLLTSCTDRSMEFQDGFHQASPCQNEGLWEEKICKIQTGVQTFSLYWFGSAQISLMRAGSPFLSASCGLGMGSLLWGHTPATDGMIKSQILVWKWSCVMGYHRHLSFIWFIISANYPNKSVFEWNLALTLHVKGWNYCWGANREDPAVDVRELVRLDKMQAKLGDTKAIWNTLRAWSSLCVKISVITVPRASSPSTTSAGDSCGQRPKETHCWTSAFLYSMKFAVLKTTWKSHRAKEAKAALKLLCCRLGWAGCRCRLLC